MRTPRLELCSERCWWSKGAGSCGFSMCPLELIPARAEARVGRLGFASWGRGVRQRVREHVRGPSGGRQRVAGRAARACGIAGARIYPGHSVFSARSWALERSVLSCAKSLSEYSGRTRSAIPVTRSLIPGASISDSGGQSRSRCDAYDGFRTGGTPGECRSARARNVYERAP